MAYKNRFTRTELFAYGTAAVMAIGLIAIFLTAALNAPHVEG